MLDRIKAWQTSAAGIGVLLVVAGRLLQGEPVGWQEIAAALAGVGLVIAK